MTASPSPSWPCPTSSWPRGSCGRTPPDARVPGRVTPWTVVLDVVHRTYRSPSLLVLGVLGARPRRRPRRLGVGRPVPRRPLARAAAVTLLWGVVLGRAVGEVFLRPTGHGHPAGVELVNPFRTVLVPWEEIRGVETRARPADRRRRAHARELRRHRQSAAPGERDRRARQSQTHPRRRGFPLRSVAPDPAHRRRWSAGCSSTRGLPPGGRPGAATARTTRPCASRGTGGGSSRSRRRWCSSPPRAPP